MHRQPAAVPSRREARLVSRVVAGRPRLGEPRVTSARTSPCPRPNGPPQQRNWPGYRPGWPLSPPNWTACTQSWC